jgi:hypothetical protein
MPRIEKILRADWAGEMALQTKQPLFSNFNLRYERIRILPEFEE